MADPAKRKSFLERCTTALVPYNWGIKSNWARIPLTIVSPIWVGPGTLWCYAASKAVHLVEFARIVRGPGGPTLEGPIPLRSPLLEIGPSPSGHLFDHRSWDREGPGGSLGAGGRLGAGIEPPGSRLGQGVVGGHDLEPSRRWDRGPSGGLSGFDPHLNVRGLTGVLSGGVSHGAFGGVGAGLDRPYMQPTDFSRGGLTHFDTRLTTAGLGGGASPTSFGAGGLGTFDTRLNVPGLSPGMSSPSH
ncbi:MAG: hypothetical protein EOO30_07610 [Comamonadaceae bacterium]|nr:MAG: hypothetical protein EOO30_07610 [Comamonadaceae bacterium]